MQLPQPPSFELRRDDLVFGWAILAHRWPLAVSSAGENQRQKSIGTADSSTSAASEADSNELRAVREELISFTKDVFGEYFLVLKRQLSLPPTLTDNQENDATGNDGEKNKKSKTWVFVHLNKELK